ncbi:membrane-associated guanylate kinase, WW and PDZ domain-containing protein 2-like isoform X5 [Tigriopus californicus]|uniref:membrane-associated guanylate kinase, WW and PDZ domain-containing protein 2-like isoform X5 n=1 Tax=Tigriopus californicus TaxID=6832 RepID=UPI0027DA73AC|nr:membrane-associated guanylate kinase, WW and PDZ domain-containing protein 2-like isoform X5 [Tigriopus californicus]
MLKNKRSTTPVVKEKPKQAATGEKAVVFATRPSVNAECHWSEILRDIVLINDTNREISELYFDLSGGADHGQFPYVGTVSTTPDSRGISVSTSVDVRVGDVLLEVQDRKVSGYTQADVVAWIKHCLRSRDSPVVIKTVPEGAITTDLRQYLNARFPKGGVDHELQNTIRDNLYLRTVPVTTRTPRPEERHGTDYTFLSKDEFMALEKSGELLESGVYDGNHYGTPKPPSESTSSLIHQLSGGGSQSTAEHTHQHQSGGAHQTHATPPAGSQAAVNFPGAHPSSEGKRRRNRSNVEAMTAKHFEAEDDQDEDPSSMMTSGSEHQNRLGIGKDDNDRQVNGPDTPSGSSGGSSSKSGSGPHGADSGHPDSPEVLPPDDPPPTEESLGPLPPNWEKAYTDKGEAYFIDHNTGTSHWLDPRLSRVQKKRPEECDENELPFGWERIDDPHYGTYFIDHVNRRTQYENPVLVAKSMNQSGDGLVAPSYGSGTIRQGPAPPPAPPLAPPNGPAGTFPRVKKSHSPFFTRDPNQLRGERIRCQLVKSARGLGFTIVGGDDNVDEFLQIKSVVPNGPAWADGGLKTGDVLVFVNDTCVLGFTHHDMVTMFQSIATGDIVNLEVCRGYPLPFDPDDPNTEIVTTVAVTSPEQNEWASELERQRQHYQGQQPAPDAQSMPDLSHHNQYPSGTNHHLRPGSADLLGQNDYGENSSDFSSEVKNTLSAPQADGMTIPITKGGMGFGFTIADSAYGQKVKKILDWPRCKNLQEGDVLVEINLVNVRNKSHSEVVQVLKDCPRGQEANISIQRGLLSPNTNGAPGGLGTSSSNQSSPVKNKYKRDKFTADFSGLKPKSGMLFRSKTPTAEIYATQEKEKVPLRPKTPIVDTRNFNRSKTPTSMFSIPFQRNDVTRASLGVAGSTSQYDPYGGITNQMGGLNLHDYNRSQSPGRELDGNYYNQGGNYPQPGLDYPGGYQPDPLYNTTAAMYPEYNNINYSQQQMPSPGKMYGDTYQNYNGNSANPHYDPTYGYTRGAPQGDIQAYRAGSLPRNGGGSGSVTGRKESTSFEHSEPLPGGLTRWPRPERRPVPSECIELTVTLHRQDSGFGFRIVGGTEEGSQVSIGHIVPGGAADVDGRLYSGDEIIAVDGSAVLNTSHHQVVELMGEAAHQGRVTLTVRRRLFQHDSYGRIPENYPYDVTVTRRENEGFGFVIISSVSRAGSTIGRIIPGSPAERCGRLHVGDRILAVNHVDINCLHHGEIVNLIKDSGYSVVMTVGPPIDDTSSNASTSHRSSTSSMVTAQAMPTVLPPSDSAGSSIHSNNVDPRSVSVGAPLPPSQQHSATYHPHHPPPPSYLTNSNNTSSNTHPHHHISNSQVPSHSSYHHSSSTTNTGFHPSPHSNSNGSYSGMGGPVPPPHTLENYQQEDQELNMLELDDQYYAVELQRGARGFGFSIRGGREFHSMPLFVLRIAVDGPAAADGRLRVGDQIIEINGINTKNMTHGEAIELIKSGGAMVRLLVRRGKMPPSALMEQVGLSPLSPTPTVSMSAMGRPMSAMSQPSHTMMANPNAYHANLISSHSNYSNNNNFGNGYLPQHPTPPTGNGMVPTPFTAATAMIPNGHLNGPMGHSSPRMAFPPPGTAGVVPTSSASSNDQYNWYNQQNNLYHNHH